MAREIFVTLIGFKISCKRATCFGTWNSAKKGITSHAVREILLRESGRVIERNVKKFSVSTKLFFAEDSFTLLMLSKSAALCYPLCCKGLRPLEASASNSSPNAL